MKPDTELFTQRGMAHFHDAIFEGCNQSLDDEKLKTLFSALPQQLQEMANEWGLSDTEVGDAICRWARENQPKG